ncbi:MAG: hypothetical protein GF329_07725 [Candidatus Lokiarchaeota archaeon]|nr:hypothetical protein [Candidatus Lokiarchaeota archaeon]
MEENQKNVPQISGKKSCSSKIQDYFKNIFDFSEYGYKTIIFILLFLLLLVFSVVLLYWIYFIDKAFIYRIVIQWFVNPIHSLGFLGIFLFLMIMAIQGLLVPIPSEIVLLAAGMIWQFIGGGIMGIIGSMAAGLLCFYVSRKGGRPLAEKFVGKTAIDMADEYINKYGIVTIIIARFLPFIAFDPISYASGLVDLDIKKYSIATLIGSVPRAFFYSYLGSILISAGDISLPLDLESLPEDVLNTYAATFNNIMLVVFGILVIIFIAYLITSKIWEVKKKIK